VILSVKIKIIRLSIISDSDNESHPPPAILLDVAVEHKGKVDLRWQQLEVVGKPSTITQYIR
jgi:hypothetical protein